MQPPVFIWGLLTLSLFCATSVQGLPYGWDRAPRVQDQPFGWNGAPRVEEQPFGWDHAPRMIEDQSFGWDRAPRIEDQPFDWDRAPRIEDQPFDWDHETSIQVLQFGCEKRDHRSLPTANLYSVPMNVCNRILQVLRSGRGTQFNNNEGCLPQGGKYNEYDVDNPRNPQRIVVDRTGSARKVYYTPNHYYTFVKVTGIPFPYPSRC